MSSWMYFLLLLSCLTGLSLFVWLSLRTHTFDSWYVIIVMIMCAIFIYELAREVIIFETGVVPSITYSRIVILRFEHTWLGLFIGEVLHYVRILTRKS